MNFSKKLFSILSAGFIMMASAVMVSCGDDEPAPSGLAGTWGTSMSVNVIGQPLNVSVDYVISDNADGSINVVVPAYDLNVQMGPTNQMQMHIGSFTVKNIAYDANKKAYYKAYADGQLGLEFNMAGSPAKTYKFDNNKCTSEITVSTSEDGKISIINNYSLEGTMPYAIKTSASGTKK